MLVWILFPVFSFYFHIFSFQFYCFTFYCIGNIISSLTELLNFQAPLRQSYNTPQVTFSLINFFQWYKSSSPIFSFHVQLFIASLSFWHVFLSLKPDFEVSTANLNPVDIFRRWCKLNFGLLRGHVKSRHFTAILLKGWAQGDNIFTFYTDFLE